MKLLERAKKVIAIELDPRMVSCTVMNSSSCICCIPWTRRCGGGSAALQLWWQQWKQQQPKQQSHSEAVAVTGAAATTASPWRVGAKAHARPLSSNSSSGSASSGHCQQRKSVHAPYSLVYVYCMCPCS
jgi:hypothetical protein